MTSDGREVICQEVLKTVDAEANARAGYAEHDDGRSQPPSTATALGWTCRETAERCCGVPTALLPTTFGHLVGWWPCRRWWTIDRPTSEMLQSISECIHGPEKRGRRSSHPGNCGHSREWTSAKWPIGRYETRNDHQRVNVRTCASTRMNECIKLKRLSCVYRVVCMRFCARTPLLGIMRTHAQVWEAEWREWQSSDWGLRTGRIPLMGLWQRATKADSGCDGDADLVVGHHITAPRYTTRDDAGA